MSRTDDNLNELVAMPTGIFMETCLGWKEDLIKNGEWERTYDDIHVNVLKCPVHQYATHKGLCKSVTGGTSTCPVCGNWMCPTCNSHAVDIMSRVTGYLQIVSGWNAAKGQEFEDRNRYTLS